jgi:dipeptidyl aminopeptidase/acylaminoacyl peptidase
VKALIAVVSLSAFGCTAGAEPQPSPTTPGTALATTASPTPTSPVATPEPGAASTTPAPAPPHPVSLPALASTTFDGRDLEVGQVLDQTSAYTRYAITYTSGELTISGIMNVPDGDGPFPVLVLAHGFIDPDIYTTGRGLAREQDYLARDGYVVLHTDYRNHAGSDDDPDHELRLRLGYAEDVINAVLAVRASDLPYLDGDRVGLLGRSMGGGVTYDVLVTAPGLVDAAVVYAPVSSDAADNFDRWMRDGPVGDEIIEAYGDPDDEPEFWRQRSARTFFDRITEPVLIHHGTADDTCPLEWSHETLDALEAAGVDAELIEWDGEPHAFEAAWVESIERTAEFFEAHLDG